MKRTIFSTKFQSIDEQILTTQLLIKVYLSIGNSHASTWSGN